MEKKNKNKEDIGLSLLRTLKIIKSKYSFKPTWLEKGYKLVYPENMRETFEKITQDEHKPQ